MAEVFHIDGHMTELGPPAKLSGYSLAEVKRALGLSEGQLIQELPVGGGEALLMDENAKLQDDPPPLNLPATMYAQLHGALFEGDYIVGDAMRVHCAGGKWL
jgi:hypothetical protein